MDFSSNHAIGVGLRSPHIAEILTQKPSIGWLEIHSENYFNVSSLARQQLRQIRNDYPLSCHGVGASLGSVDPLDLDHLQKLKQLIDETEPFLISEHLSWSSINGEYFNDLLPLPYTEEALNNFCQKVEQVQTYLKRPILIENPSSYLQFTHSTMPEWEFLTAVQQRTDCGLLLDLNNIYVSSFNHHFDCQNYLNAIDPTTVKEVHLAGFTSKQLPQGEIWIDTHSKPVSQAVWALYQQWLKNNGTHIPTLIEWDADIPPLAVLLNEANKAQIIIDKERAIETKATEK